MRTTLDIDADVLAAAKELASLRRTTAGKVISELARKGLRRSGEETRTRNGVPLLPPREDARPVSSADVQRILDEV